MRRLHLLAGALLAAAMACGPAQAEGQGEEASFKDWAGAFLAADWRDGGGRTIEAFDNASRDLAKAFATAGLKPANIADLSLRPNIILGTAPTSRKAFEAIEAKTKSAQSGCLLYFTSHGSPEGIVLGNEGLLSPERMDTLVDQWCGERPTVVVISACYSGAFLPAMSAPNRMVMTAARPDRTSFGCSADATYPYFDACVLESLPDADDFVHLSSLTRGCVARREQRENLWPRSEPLTTVGADVEDMLIFTNFKRPAPVEEDLITLPSTP